MDHYKFYIFLIFSYFFLILLMILLSVNYLKSDSKPNKNNILLIVLSFLSLSSYLYFCGKQFNHCPIYFSNEIFVFLSWSIMVSFFLNGKEFYLSVLTLFVLPIILLLCLPAFIYEHKLIFSDEAQLGVLRNKFLHKPITTDPNLVMESMVKKHSLGLELHITFILLAFGAIFINFLSAIFFILENMILKSKKITNKFFKLPPLKYIITSMRRLIIVSFILMLFSVISILAMEINFSDLKIIISIFICIYYMILFLLNIVKKISNISLAYGSIIGFFIFIVTMLISYR